MSAQINYVQSLAEARFRLKDEHAKALGQVSPAIERTVATLAARLPPGTTVHVARDRQDCCLAVVEDAHGRDPIGEAFALAADGRIGFGGVNQPRYYDTVDELLASEPAE